MSTSQKPICCVRGCCSPEDNIQDTLFVFPPNTNPRSKRWLELYPHSFILQPSGKNYICGRHFTAECFNKNGALLLKANPSVNIDTSYAQDILMKSFIMKLLYEWVLRNSIEDYALVIWDKVLEAKVLLGIQMYTLQSVWVSKFRHFMTTNQKDGKRFGSGQHGPKNIHGIIKDIRQELPSNFVLSADYIAQCTPGDKQIKDKVEDDDVICSLYEKEEPADEPIQRRDVIPHNSLDTYEEALDLMGPLKNYVKWIGNENASARLKEIETILKQAIRNESQPKRASRRRRN